MWFIGACFDKSRDVYADGKQYRFVGSFVGCIDFSTHLIPRRRRRHLSATYFDSSAYRCIDGRANICIDACADISIDGSVDGDIKAAARHGTDEFLAPKLFRRRWHGDVTIEWMNTQPDAIIDGSTYGGTDNRRHNPPIAGWAVGPT